MRDDAIIATGRSDYPNQVNNVLGFPFIFRGALDVRATEINEEMKMAATRALALLAKEDVPDSVCGALRTAAKCSSAPSTSFPSRSTRACCSGSRRPSHGRRSRRARRTSSSISTSIASGSKRGLGRARGVMRGLINRATSNPKRVVFPEGEEPKIIRAARICVEDGIAEPILLGNIETIRAKARAINVPLDGIVIEDPATSPQARRVRRSTCGTGASAKA